MYNPLLDGLVILKELPYETNCSLSTAYKTRGLNPVYPTAVYRDPETTLFALIEKPLDPVCANS